MFTLHYSSIYFNFLFSEFSILNLRGKKTNGKVKKQTLQGNNECCPKENGQDGGINGNVNTEENEIRHVYGLNHFPGKLGMRLEVKYINQLTVRSSTRVTVLSYFRFYPCVCLWLKNITTSFDDKNKVKEKDRKNKFKIRAF